MTGASDPPRLAGPWRAPTRVLVGRHLGDALGAALDGLGGRRHLVVADGAAVAANPAIAALLAASHHVRTAETVLVSGAPTLADVHALHARIAAAGCDVVVAVGGGAALDLGRAGAACVAEPALFDPVRWRDPHGVVRGPGCWRPRPLVAAVPTTFWTGAEVSPVAVIRRSPHGDKRVVVSPSLLADLAVLDAASFASLPDAAARGGVVELLARLLVPLLARPPLLAELDGPGIGAVAATVQLAGRLGDCGGDTTELALALAVLGADDKARLAGTGRDPYANTAWYLAAAVEDLVGCGKQAALGAVLPAYLAVAAEGGGRPGTLPFRPVTAALVERALDLPPDPGAGGVALARRVRELVVDLRAGRDGCDLGLASADAPLLLARARARWAPALAGVGDDVVLDVFRRAVRPSTTTLIPGGRS